MPAGQYGYDASGAPLSAGSPERNTLALILGALQGLLGITPGGGGGIVVGGSGLPYGADTQVITNVAAGPSVIVYKSGGTGGTTLKTRTLSYTNAGVSSTDVLVSTVDT